MVSKAMAVGMLCVIVPLGAVSLQVRDGRPVVDGVYVNGHGPYRFLVDTGSNVNLIERGLTRTLGMPEAFLVELTASAGKTTMPGSDDNEVTLGPVHAGGQKFLYSTMDAIHRQMPDVRGVLGQWFLSRFDYLLDLRGKRLEFGKQDFKGARAQSRYRNGRTAISTSLGDLVLDSGVARLVRFGVTPDSGPRSGLLTLAGLKAVGMVASRLAIEGRDVWHGDALAIEDREEAGVAGLLPLSLFNTVYVSNSESYVEFK
jgi:hypothetical protein